MRAPTEFTARVVYAVAHTVVLGRECLRRAIQIEFVDRSVALASLAFTALVPLGVVTGSLLPSVGRRNLADSITDRFQLDADTAGLVHDLFAPPEDVRSATSAAGLLLLVVAALSFTRGLQRVYERSWQLPSLGVRGTPAGLKWLAGVVIFLAVFAGTRAWLTDLVGPVLDIAVALVTSALIWLVTPHTLLSRRVAWTDLVPTAVLTSVCMTTLSIGSVLYMPGAIADSAKQYGQIGVTISLVSWLVAVGFVLVGCAAVGAVLAERIDGRWDAQLRRMVPRLPRRHPQ